MLLVCIACIFQLAYFTQIISTVVDEYKELCGLKPGYLFDKGQL